MPRRQSDNDLVKGAGEKAPLKVKGNFRRFPHPLFTAILTTHVDPALLARTAHGAAGFSSAATLGGKGYFGHWQTRGVDRRWAPTPRCGMGDKIKGLDDRPNGLREQTPPRS